MRVGETYLCGTWSLRGARRDQQGASGLRAGEGR